MKRFFIYFAEVVSNRPRNRYINDYETLLFTLLFFFLIKYGKSQ